MSWDLTALLNAADPDASLAERNLWLVRLLEWLRQAPREEASGGTPLAVVRLKHLLNVLERHPEHAYRFSAVGDAFAPVPFALAFFFAAFPFGPAPSSRLFHSSSGFGFAMANG